MRDNFQNLISSGSEPRVLVENGEPRYVIMPWAEFEAMRGNAPLPARALYAGGRVRFAEVANEVLDVPAYAPVRRSFVKLAVDSVKIRLEDLPV